MTSDKALSKKRIPKESVSHGAFKVVYYFAFPIVVSCAILFGIGLLFRSAEGQNARLICGICSGACTALGIALYLVNARLSKNPAYRTFSYPFMKKVSPLSLILLIVFLLITLIPFYVVVINSIKTSHEANAIGFTFFPKQGVVFDHYEQLFKNTTGIGINLVVSFFNSLFYAIVPVFIGTFVSAFAAYGFAKLNYPGRAFVYNFMIFTLMVPACVSMASSYAMYDAFGWTRGTGFSLVMTVPGCFGGIGCVMFLREFFKGIPDGLLEAARIDGCGKLKIFTTIMIPLGMPAIIAQLVLGFIGNYNDYQSALIYLKYPEQYTVQLALSFFNDGNVDKALAAAAAVFGIIPLLILYIVFQKKIISGISFSSGLKG